MKKELLELLGKAKDSISHHSPEILVACGITGMITATALAISATPKAEKAIEEKKDELEVEHLTKIDLAKTVSKNCFNYCVSWMFNWKCQYLY